MTRRNNDFAALNDNLRAMNDQLRTAMAVVEQSRQVREMSKRIEELTASLQSASIDRSSDRPPSYDETSFSQTSRNDDFSGYYPSSSSTAFPGNQERYSNAYCTCHQGGCRVHGHSATSLSQGSAENPYKAWKRSQRPPSYESASASTDMASPLEYALESTCLMICGECKNPKHNAETIGRKQRRLEYESCALPRNRRQGDIDRDVAELVGGRTPWAGAIDGLSAITSRVSSAVSSYLTRSTGEDHDEGDHFAEDASTDNNQTSTPSTLTQATQYNKYYER